MTVTTIPTAAFQYRAENAQALASTAQLRSSVEGLNGVKLGGLNSQFAGLGASIGRLIPVMSAATLGTFALSAVRAADAMGDAAERANLSVETFSRLNHVAQKSDVEFSELTTAIKKYQIGLSDAARGTGPLLGAIGDLNLSAQTLRRLPLEEQLALIAEQFRTVVPSIDKTRVAVDLFGRSGEALIPLLNKGAAGVKELMEESDRLGITLNSRSVAAIDKATKAVGSFWQAVKSGTANQTGRLLADLFGTDDELIDLETKYERLQARLRGFEANRVPNASGAQRIADIKAALDELEPRLKVLRELRDLEAGGRLSSGPLTRRADPLQEVKITVKKIDEEANQVDRIMAEIAERRKREQNEYRELQVSSMRSVSEASLREQEDSTRDVNRVLAEQLEERMRLSDGAREHERSQEASLQEDILYIRQQGALAAQSLLTAYGGRLASVGKAILIFEKGMALKSIFMDTQAAMMKVIKQYGAPWGYVAAGGVAIYGAARAAAVASTVAGGDSAPAMGSPHNPTYTAPASDDLGVGGSSDPAGSRVVQLVINGNFYGNREMVDYMLSEISERINQYDTVVISRDSRQARELTEEQ